MQINEARKIAAKIVAQGKYLGGGNKADHTFSKYRLGDTVLWVIYYLDNRPDEYRFVSAGTPSF